MTARPLLVLLIALLLPMQAWAHAQLRGAEPEAGALVDEAPTEIVLTFNEPIAPLQARWFAPDGSAQDAQSRASGNDLVVTVPDGIEQGTQALSWRVVSADGHPVGGTHVFSIGVETGPPEAQAAPAPWPAAIARGLMTLALAFGVGGLLWQALSGLPVPGARMAALLTVPAAGLMLATQTMDMAGSGLAVLASGSAWSTALFSPYGPAVIFGALAGLLALGARSDRWLLMLACFLAALSFAVAGHAARAEPVWLMGPLVFLHALALIFWAGALPGLFSALRAPDAAARMARFSSFALPMVVLLVASGGVLAFRQIETPQALLTTAYGWVFLTKMVLVLAILALALRHRFALTPALATNAEGGRPAFARSLRLELVLMVAILALTAAFRMTPPPRAIAEMPESRVELHIHGPNAMADVVLMPGRPGQNRVEIMVTDGDFQPFTPLEVTLFFSRPADGLEPIELRAELREDGLWHAGPFHLPPGGPLDVTADILITDFRKALIAGELQLMP